MPRRIGSKRRQHRRKTFLREWRKVRGLSLEQAGSRFDMSAAQLSRIETGQSPYNQDFLEHAAEAYQTDVASLLMRDPSKDDALWSIWDQAKEGERRQIEDFARFTVGRKTGT